MNRPFDDEINKSIAEAAKKVMEQSKVDQEAQPLEESPYKAAHKELKGHVDAGRHKTLAHMFKQMDAGADEKETISKYHFGAAQSKVHSVLKKHGIGESVEQIEEGGTKAENKWRKRMFLRKKGGKKIPVGYSPDLAIPAAVRAGREQLRKEEAEQVDEKLVGKQHKLDANKNKKVDAQDFKILRNRQKGDEDVQEGYVKAVNKKKKNLYTRMLAKDDSSPYASSWKAQKAATQRAGREKLKEGFLMEEAAPALSSAMKAILADAFHMYFKAHTFHWNVEGANFPEYHKFFGDVYEQLFATIDPIAEEIRALGEYAPRSLSELKGSTSIEESAVQTPAEMFAALLSDNEKIIAGLTTGYKIAEGAGELGLSNFLQDKIDAHKKLGWMIKSTAKGV